MFENVIVLKILKMLYAKCKIAGVNGREFRYDELVRLSKKVLPFITHLYFDFRSLM